PIGETSRVHHQSISVPMTAGIPHPELRTFEMRASVHSNVPEGMRIFRSNQRVAGSLENLERKMKVHGSGNAGHETLRQRIRRPGVSGVLGLLFCRLRRVWESPTADQKFLDVRIGIVVCFPDS